MLGLGKKIAKGLAAALVSVFLLGPVDGIATAEAGWTTDAAAGTVVKKRKKVFKNVTKTIRVSNPTLFGPRFVRRTFRVVTTTVKNLLTNKTSTSTKRRLIRKRFVKRNAPTKKKIVAVKRANCINKTSPVTNKCKWKSI